MKLNEDQIRRVSANFGAGPVPETTRAHDHLKHYFGDHTFFLGPSGAFVWEPVGEPEAGSLELQALQIASWADKERTLLQRETPEPMGKTVRIK